jgi:5'-3' exonuclease/transcription antitermination factor NusG
MAEWVVLELSPKAENEDPDFIRASIRHMIKDAEVYIPVSVTKVGEDRVINYLVDGYAFIRRAHPDEKYFRLEGSRYVQTVISSATRVNGRMIRTLACASDSDIARFRGQVHAEENQGIGVGDTVVVTSGPWRQIQAKVIEDIPEREEVQVHIKLRSKEDLVTLPRSFLRLVERAAKSPYLERVESFRTWFNATKPFLTSDVSAFTTITEKHETLSDLDRLVNRRAPLDGFFQVVRSNLDVRPIGLKYLSFMRLERAVQGSHFVKAVASKPSTVAPIREQGARVTRLEEWGARWKMLLPVVEKLHTVHKQAYSPPWFEQLQAKFVNWAWVEDVVERLDTLKNDLDSIERSMTEPLPQIDTIIIDGHNLAVRCAVVPGLDSLTDTKGRHTGAIVGVLRSLGSFRKKFPGAEVIVVWDGSNQRRRTVFPDYKANRPTGGVIPSGSNGSSLDQVHWLREVLPFLGVKQVWNPEEEADDVIAALVRKDPKKNYVVITTDRDLLQLVSSNVRLFVPGKDKLFDATTVEVEFGVRPEHMVHLRALDGDTSDNIPGVPGFGLKTAAKLLRLYGTVEGIYASNFAGVSPSQYTKLRAAEKQVRLNVQLMSLHPDVPLMIVDPNPNQIVASQRLQDVDVKSEPILAAMLGGG